MFDLNENPMALAYLVAALIEIEQSKNKRANR